MNGYGNMLAFSGEPCDEVRIVEIEKAIGYRLPHSYREFVKTSGGGILHLDHCVFPGSYSEEYPLGLPIETVFNNGMCRSTNISVDI